MQACSCPTHDCHLESDRVARLSGGSARVARRYLTREHSSDLVEHRAFLG